jgi:pimeloyl-ACP methyl ester carboxylesterase
VLVTDTVPASLSALGICLEEYECPYPVQFLPLSSDLQPVSMGYGDIPPDTEPNGKTVVLFHGKAFGGYYFRNVIEALTGAGYRVIAADQIGWGKSSKPDVHYSFQLLAANTAALLDHLGVQQVAVLGHSTGGMTAARFTLMNPGRVTHLVLEDPLGLADYRTGIPPQSEETLFNASPRLKPGDFWLRRDPARSPGREEGGMSYVVGTSQDALTLDQDYPGGIPVAVCGVTAVLATEGSFGQLEWQLVSRKTLRAGHSGVGGRNRHHLPARPLAVPGQRPLESADRGVGRFAGHVRLREELRLEVLDRDHVMAGDDPLRPHPAVVRVLPGGLLQQPRGLTLCLPVPLDWGPWSFPPRVRLRRDIFRCARATCTAHRLRWPAYGKS